METVRSFISVGLMELCYDMEKSKFVNFLKEKASYLKYLDSREYFERPDTDVIKTQKIIDKLRYELQMLYGFLQASEQLKNSYECQLEKIHDAYESQMENLIKKDHD